MLQAFFDGSTEQDKALIFSGYIGTVDTWLKFSDDWGELLTLKPHLVPFKMSQAAASEDMMERAMFHYRAIERAKIYGVCCAIPIEPLAKVVRELNVDPKWSNPFYLAWRSAITLSLVAAERLGSLDPIEFVFDDQTDKAQLIQAWDEYYASVPPNVRERIRGIPSFKKDDDVEPLQAADLLAWWARRQYILDKSKMGDLFPESWTCGKVPDLFAVNFPEESIREQFLRDMDATDRENAKRGGA